MIIRIGYELTFEVSSPTAMVLMLYAHPECADRLKHREELRTEPHMALEEFIDGFGNRCARILAPVGVSRLSYDNLIDDAGQPEPVYPDARQLPVQELPVEALQFLLPSRYCEVDRLSEVAWSLFGHTPPGWPRVQAICDWVWANVEFGYLYARSTKTAWDVYEERNGVCRDFTHLAVTFCRCMHIPARYATGYLGDIGVPPAPDPMDFSAFFEVYLDGRWHPFDARNNARRVGRVLMARGRDATDVAMVTSFGPHVLKTFTVWTDEISPTDTVPQLDIETLQLGGPT